MSGELLTVVEVAGRLGITDRALRRKLARPEYASQLGVLTHQTRTGTRTAAGLPPGLVQALLEENERGGNADTNVAGGGETRTVEGTLPAPVYQKIIADKDAEIVYLREQLSLAQQNLAREFASRPLLTGSAQQWEPFWRKWLRRGLS